MAERWQDFYGPNAGYVLELYDRYLQDPNTVDAATRAFFQHWTPPPTDGAAPVTATPAAIEKVTAVANLASAIREYGHLDAQLDPLGSDLPGDPTLRLETHSLSEADLRRLPASIVGGPLAHSSISAWEAIQALRGVYSSSIGYDYDHLRLPEERAWLRDMA